MKRLWQAVMETMESGFLENDIFLDVTDTASPYGEATMKNAYNPYGVMESRIAVNPYYSYEAVFDHLISPGKVPELTRFLCDLVLHHLFETDSLSGMDLEEFYVRFLEEDLKAGALGIEVPLMDFTEKEIRKIAWYYLRLCRTGCYDACFCGLLLYLYENAWVNAREDGSVVLIVNRPYSEEEERRIRAVRRIFLQAGRVCHIYWDIPPGIIECESTTLGNFVLFGSGPVTGHSVNGKYIEE